MTKTVEYKLVYKLPNVCWKSFLLNADNDMEAVKETGKWLNTSGEVNRYFVEKRTILTERLI